MTYKFDFTDLTIEDRLRIDREIENIAEGRGSFAKSISEVLQVAAKYVHDIDILAQPAVELTIIFQELCNAYTVHLDQEPDAGLSDIWNQWGK